MPKEECPYEALVCVFNEYFTDTNWINTNEDYLNFGWGTKLLSLPLFTFIPPPSLSLRMFGGVRGISMKWYTKQLGC